MRNSKRIQRIEEALKEILEIDFDSWSDKAFVPGWLKNQRLSDIALTESCQRPTRRGALAEKKIDLLLEHLGLEYDSSARFIKKGKKAEKNET